MSKLKIVSQRSVLGWWELVERPEATTATRYGCGSGGVLCSRGEKLFCVFLGSMRNRSHQSIALITGFTKHLSTSSDVPVSPSGLGFRTGPGLQKKNFG